MTQAELDALIARRAALDAAIAVKILQPESASNAMGSVSQRPISDMKDELARLDELIDGASTTSRPPFERWQFRFPGTV